MDGTNESDPQTARTRDSSRKAVFSRRRLLGWLSLAAVGTAGCTESPSAGTTPTTETDGTQEDSPEGDSVTVADLSVGDFILYPLAGNHPHVHREPDTQYVVVRTETALSFDALRERLTLQLDGTTVPLAERQPVPWEQETVDLAFAVEKGPPFDSGTILFDGDTVYSLSDSALERLSNPPAFSVSAPSVSPSEIPADSETDVTVRFSLANTGEGAGTFGASLQGNHLSGSQTVTATVSPGGEREVTATTTLFGAGESATVRLDWGADEWTTDVSVVDESAASEPAPPTDTETPS